MTTQKLIKRLEKKGYPLWKIHSILSLYGVELRPVIDINQVEALCDAIGYQQRLHDASVYIDELDDWDKIK